MTKAEIETLNIDGLLHDDFTPLTTALKENHTYWMAKENWYHIENGQKVINDNAPEDVKADYLEYLKASDKSI